MHANAAIYWHHLRARLEYRRALLFSVLIHPLVMLVTLSILRGMYAQRGDGRLLGYSLTELVWYFGATQFFYQLVWNTLEKEIGERVLSGRIARDLTRPCSLFRWELLQLCAQKTLCAVFEFVPVSLVYAGVCFPDFLTGVGLARYLVLMAFAFWQFFLLSFTLASLVFVWQDPSSLAALKLLIVHLLSGAALPYAFYPSAVRGVLERLPFRFFFHTPVAHLLGRAGAGWESFAGLLVEELLWSLALLGLARVSHGWLVRRSSVAGG